MLSRVANSLYWMSRYIERAENIARIVDVNLQLLLDLRDLNEKRLAEHWLPIVLTTGDEKQFFDLHRDWSLLFGLSAALGPNASGEDQRTAVYGTDLYLKYRPLVGAHPTVVTWQTEVLHRRRQVSGEVLWDTSGYSQVAVRFARRWSAAARYEAGSPAYALGGSIAEDPLDPAWTRFRHRATAALTHFPSELSRFRLQGSRDMGGAGDPIWAAFLTAEVVVGAHGAHTF